MHLTIFELENVDKRFAFYFMLQVANPTGIGRSVHCWWVLHVGCLLELANCGHGCSVVRAHTVR